MRVSLKSWVLLFVLAVGLLAQDCSAADQSLCGVTGSACQYYTYNNGTCTAPTSCPTDTIWLNSTSNCLVCADATQTQCTDCSSFNFYFNTNQNSCLKCSLSYGSACTTCSTSGCSACSNGLGLSADNQSCVDTSCNIQFCSACQNSTHCQSCDASHTLVNNVCVCRINNCELCSNAYCDKCFDGYELSSQRTSCTLICLENCDACTVPIDTNCVTPAFGYTYSAGRMVLNCAQISVSNCATCTSPTTCTSCNTGFELNPSGTLCVEQCTDTNCVTCATSVSICTQCTTGYFVENNACSLAFCSISDCLTCATATTCGTCATLFSLANSATECQPTCIGSEPQCVTCATATTCSICASGFTAVNGACQAVCTITGCDLCESSTRCKLCQNDMTLSANRKSCEFVCNILGCVTCASASTCSTCDTGFNRVGNTCEMQCGTGFYLTGNSCTVCPGSNCKTCESNGVCNLCDDLYYLDATFICRACSTITSNCFNCLADAATCTDCDAGYTLSSGACVLETTIACGVSNCRVCVTNDATTCSQCDNGYELQTNGTCAQPTCLGELIEINGVCTCGSGSYALNNNCEECGDANCVICTSTACTQCKTGYYPSGNTCVRCARTCSSCTATECLTCKRGFDLSSGVCQVRSFRRVALGLSNNNRRIVCPTGCSQCSLDVGGNVACSVAAEGYTISGGQLQKCDPNCKTCSATINANTQTYSTCITCYDSFVFRAGSCIQCTDTGVLTCSSTDPAYALTCRATFTVRSGNCVACADHCLTCDVNGGGSCDRNGCRPGYNQIGSDPTNMLCTSCFNGCFKCEATNPNNCLECGSRRYVSGGTCLSCISLCIECTDGTTCTTCEAGYAVASDGTCQQPPGPPCTEYDSSFTCTACDVNYNLSGGNCVLDLTCNGTSTCTSCNFNFYLSGGQCFTCPSINNCQACNPNNQNVCFLCNDGFYLDGTSTCQACGTGCANCDSNNFCTEAQATYYLETNQNGEATGTVGSCTSPCANCQDSATTCLSCLPTFNLQGTKCISENTFSVGIVATERTLIGRTVSGGEELGVTFRNLGRFSREIGNRIGFGTNTQFERASVFRRVALSSVNVDFTVNSAGINDPGTTLGTATFTDFTTVSTSSTTNTSTSGSDSSINLALVLGVAIPLLILIIAIIIIVKVKSGEEVTPETGETPGWSEKEMEFYDNQVEM